MTNNPVTGNNHLKYLKSNIITTFSRNIKEISSVCVCMLCWQRAKATGKP